jgi:hypothetical protein
MMEQKMDYLHNNPVEAGFVSEPQHWKYSSVGDYVGSKGNVEIEQLAVSVPRSGTIPVGVNPTRAIDCSP